MLAEHIGNCLRVHVVRHDKRAVCLLVMADGLLMKALPSRNYSRLLRSDTFHIGFKHLASTLYS